MAFTEVTSESWFGRIGKSIVGALIGLLLFVVAFPVLFWNEGRAVQTAKSLTEGLGAVKSVPADHVDPAFDQKLVHLSGDAKTTETLTDSEFGIAANAIKLNRDVEMYQWEETKKSDTRKKLGGGTETVTRYDYKQTWSDSLIDSSEFREGGHTNPSRMPYASKAYVAQKVTLGAFRLSPDQIKDIDDAEPLSVETLKGARDTRARVEGGGLYVGRDSSSPAIGDVRITFTVVRPGPVSIVALQTGDTFAPYQTKAGDAISLVEKGTLSADQMFKAAQDKNTVLTWILRVCGWAAMFIGLMMAMKPLSVLGDVIPFIGSIIGAGSGLFAFLIASALSSVTVAVAWIAYRPLLGIGLLVVAGGAIYLLVARGKQKAQGMPQMRKAA